MLLAELPQLLGPLYVPCPFDVKQKLRLAEDWRWKTPEKPWTNLGRQTFTLRQRCQAPDVNAIHTVFCASTSFLLSSPTQGESVNNVCKQSNFGRPPGPRSGDTLHRRWASGRQFFRRHR